MCPRSVAGVPSSQALPGYLIPAPPSVCVPAVLGALAVWIQYQTKKSNKSRRRLFNTTICAERSDVLPVSVSGTWCQAQRSRDSRRSHTPFKSPRVPTVSSALRTRALQASTSGASTVSVTCQECLVAHEQLDV